MFFKRALSAVKTASGLIQKPVEKSAVLSQASVLLPPSKPSITVRIYSPAKTAMQSGTANMGSWKIDFPPESKWENSLIGWSSSSDPLASQ